MRIGLTISGAVSLGAFEGGALAALITGVQACQTRRDGTCPPVRIDAIGAASAGSITAVLAARALTAGVDPVWAMEQAWVVKARIGTLLRKAGVAAPLSMDGLEETAVDVLEADGHLDRGAVQTSAVNLHLALTNLRGLDYEIASLRDGKPGSGRIEASTYLDWAQFTVTDRWQVRDYVTPRGRSAVEAALASGANELGFPPMRLARSLDDYEPQEIRNFPASGRGFWYTDGGTIDNEPLGRTMDLANAIDSDDGDPLGDERRVQLLIHPSPSSSLPVESLAWADESRRPTWIRTLARAFDVIRTQSLVDDLRRAEKVNSRLVWSARFRRAIDHLIAGMSPAEQARWQATMEELLAGIERDVSSIPRHRSQGAPARGCSLSTPAADAFGHVLDRVAGLAGKHPVGIEVISPSLAESTAGLPLDRVLAGDLLENFGGFFDEGLRRSDFALGYVSMLNWMSRGLEAYGMHAGDCRLATDAALRRFYGLPRWRMRGREKGFAAYGLTKALRQRAAELDLSSEDSWTPTDFGTAGLADLPIGSWFDAARVAGRIGLVALVDVVAKVTGRDRV